MVNANKKNLSLLLLLGLCSILVAYLVFAAGEPSVFVTGGNMTFPADGGNYSSTMTVNCSFGTVVLINTTDWDFNVSVYYNSSDSRTFADVPVDNTTALVTINNNTAGVVAGGDFEVSLDIAALADGMFNFTCVAGNSSEQEWSGSTNETLIDNTAPYVGSFFAVVNGENYSSSDIVINLSADDALVGMNEGYAASVYINITNASDGTEINFTKATNYTSTIALSGNYSITISPDTFTDGYYNITPYTNDSLNNINATEKKTITIAIDNTAPAINNFSCNPLNSESQIRAGTTLTCVCEVTDFDGSIEVNFTQHPSTATIGTYTTTCESSDMQTNNVSSSLTYKVLGSLSTGGGVGSTSGGASTTTTWTSTFVYDNKELSQQEPLTKEIAESGRVRVKVNNQQHYVGVKDVTATTAKIEVSSNTTQEATLNIGDTRKFDVNADQMYDLSVKLNSIVGTKADLTVQSISGAVTAETTAEEVEKEQQAAGTAGAEAEEGTSKTTLWIVIIVAVIALAIIAFVIIKKRK